MEEIAHEAHDLVSYRAFTLERTEHLGGLDDRAVGVGVQLQRHALRIGRCSPALDSAGICQRSRLRLCHGLGTLAITFNPGAAGSYYVLAYLDHDLNTLANGFDDELAEPFGVLPAGLIGEIDRPLDGDIYWHVIGDLPGDGLGSDSDPVVPDGPGTFDSFFDVFVGDVSMGLGWNFILAADELATISYHVGTSAPAGGFYLRQLDGGVPSGGVDPIALYFNSTIDIHGGGGPEIPEPGTWLLMLAGLLGVGGVAKRRRTN